MLAPQIDPQFGESSIQITNGIALDLLWIKRQGEEPLQLASFRRCTNCVPVAFGSPGGTVGTRPRLAVNPVKACFRRAGSPPAHRESPTMLAPPQLLVTISLYLVKRRRRGGFAATGDSVPGPLTTFSLGWGEKRWRASLWRSASCHWSCWPYSQPRTGVVNR